MQVIVLASCMSMILTTDKGRGEDQEISKFCGRHLCMALERKAGKEGDERGARILKWGVVIVVLPEREDGGRECVPLSARSAFHPI